MLALDFTDRGFGEGIDVTIYAVGSDQILYETILTDTESRTLLFCGDPEAEIFWRCLHTPIGVDSLQKLFLTARCRFNPLAIDISTKSTGRPEVRNAGFLRLVEEVLDELMTREPGLLVEVALTHRDPAFANCVNFNQ